MDISGSKDHINKEIEKTHNDNKILIMNYLLYIFE